MVSTAVASPPDPPELLCSRTITPLSETEFLVELRIENRAVSGYARLKEELPQGFQAFEVKSSSGIFHFREGEVKLVWMQVPEDEELVVLYKLDAIRAPSGQYAIKGSAAWQGSSRPAVRQLKETRFSFQNELWTKEQAELAALAEAQRKQQAARDSAAQADADRQALRNQEMEAEAKNRRRLLEVQELLAKNQRDKAMRKLRELQSEEPEFEDAGNLLSKLEAEIEAEATEERYDASMQKAEELFHRGEYESARVAFEEALQIIPDREDALAKIRAIDRIEAEQLRLDSIRVLTAGQLEEAQRFREAENYIAAEELLMIAFENNPEMTEVGAELREVKVLAAEQRKGLELQDLLIKAQGHFQKKEYAKSKAAYQKVLALDPASELATIRLTAIEEIETSAEAIANRTDDDWLNLIAQAAEAEDENVEALPQKEKKVVSATVNYDANTETELSPEEKAARAEEAWEKQRIDRVMEEKKRVSSLPEGAREKLGGLIYKVQLMAGKSELTETEVSQRFEIDEPISKSRHNGMYRYMAGEFETETEANTFRDQLHGNGYADTFVVIFFNGKRISRAEAALLLEE